jgi:hypothetical protein
LAKQYKGIKNIYVNSNYIPNIIVVIIDSVYLSGISACHWYLNPTIPEAHAFYDRYYAILHLMLSKSSDSFFLKLFFFPNTNRYQSQIFELTVPTLSQSQCAMDELPASSIKIL